MITKYQEFLNESKNKWSITDPEYYNIEKYKILPDGEIEVYQSLYLDKKFYKNKPFIINKVYGIFSVNYAKLKSLIGGPKIITGDFDGSDNNLKNLIGGPSIIGKNYFCSKNFLTSLEGCAQEIPEDFYCRDNHLKTLEHGPKKIGRDYYCHSNFLTSLKGSPEIAEHHFMCYFNELTNLEGGPKIVKGNFDCSDNRTMTDLIGAPKEIHGNFKMNDTFITDIELYPLSIIRGFIIGPNNHFETICKIVKENEEIFKPLLDNKIAFHQMVMRIDPSLIQYYSTIQPPSKKSIL